MKRLFGGVLLVCLLCFGVNQLPAQDLKSILSGVAKAVGNKVSGASSSIEGTWTFVGPDCKFESDNLLAKAGGEVAAQKVEDKMSGILNTLGFKEGTTYTFNADSTYTSVVGGRTTNGTYSYNAESGELTLKTRLGIKMNMVASKGLTGDKLSLFFKADKVMSLAQSILGKVSNSSSNSAVSTANSLLKEYDGLLLGFEMKKQ